MEPKNDYIARLEQAKIDKKKEKEKGPKNTGTMGQKDVSDKEDKSPIKPMQQQKITITKNAMKTKDTNKIDYGVSGGDEGNFFFFLLFIVFF